MQDPRIKKLAKNLIDYSVALKPGEKIFIDVIGNPNPLANELIKYTYEKGCMPFLSLQNDKLLNTLLQNCTKEQLVLMAELDAKRISSVDAYIGLRCTENSNEMSSVPQDKMNLYTECYLRPVHFDLRVNHTRWCILKYPLPSMAQLASMSTEQFENFFFDVCNLDYSKMSRAMDNLVDLMNKTDKVRIIGPGTNLTFSIKGLPAIKCDGQFNIPDGEVYTAPVRNSVNGTISYNTPSNYYGTKFENISFEFKDGKIINAHANYTEKLNSVLDIDEGARYIGEFALGINPYIQSPMNDTLFDEKIKGSLHFTPGNSYTDCDNGNKSAVHWDLVLIQQPNYGGGEIWFDDVLIRKDGVFVLEYLKCLNPENLV